MTQTYYHHPADENLITELTQAAAVIPPAVQTAITRYYALLEKIQALELDGITNATPYFRDEKYMYLIHPTDPLTGDRKREYIGNDAAKQTEAFARIHRHKQHQDLTAQANRIKSALYIISTSLRRTLSDLKEQ